MKRERAIHVVRKPASLRAGKWEYGIEERDVFVMARVDGYAMVRRPGCLPYVAPEEELRPALTVSEG